MSPEVIWKRARGAVVQSLKDYEAEAEEMAFLKDFKAVWTLKKAEKRVMRMKSGIIHPPFRIFYRYEQDRICIVRSWRSKRLLHLH